MTTGSGGEKTDPMADPEQNGDELSHKSYTNIQRQWRGCQKGKKQHFLISFDTRAGKIGITEGETKKIAIQLSRGK